jgi:hypothetical protein
MKRFWMLAFVAAFGMAACDTAPETADADDAMEEAADEMADDMAMTAPALGDYNLVAMEGGNPDEPIGEDDVAILNVAESTWTFTINGEQVANGTYAIEEGRNRVTYETGDCAGHESVFELTVSDGAFSQDLVESTCEMASTHTEWAMAGGDMMDDHGAMDEGEPMDDGMEEDGGDM